MLDRVPTELISLFIDATSTDAWERKALIDSLSLLSKAYRAALRPLRESIVHVSKPAVIPILRSWSAANLKAVATVLVGPSDMSDPLEPFSLRDFSRLLSILPNVRYIYLQRVQDSHYSRSDKRFYSRKMWFELNPSNPFKQCLSLSLLQSQWHFPPTIETTSFKLRRLCLDFAATEPGAAANSGWGPGLEQFLTWQRLPCLRELRISCHRLPRLSADFVDQLHAAQIDFPQPADFEYSFDGEHQIGPFSTPVLFSFDMGFFHPFRGPEIKGITFAHLRIWDASELSKVVKLLPDLKYLKCTKLRSSTVTGDLDSHEDASIADTLKYLEERSIELPDADSGEDDFVDSGFLDFLKSRGPRS